MKFLVGATAALALMGIGTFVRPKQEQQAPPSPPAITQLEVGSVTGNTYENDDVRMTYVFPEGWFVDVAAIWAANDAIKKYATTHKVSGLPPNYSASVWLIVSKNPEKPNATPGSFVPGPSIILSGVDLGPLDKGKTVAQIQAAGKEALQKQRGVLSVDGPTGFSIGGQSFSRIDAAISGIIYKGDAVTIRNRIKIEFQLVGDSKEQVDELYKSLNTIKFRNIN